MIYGFTGAQGDLINNFLKYFSNGKIMTFELSYRSTQSIIRGANNLISRNKNRIKKELKSINEDEGMPIEIKSYKDQ